MTTRCRITTLEKHVNTKSEADAMRKFFAHVNADTFDPRAWTDEQIDAALAWYRARNPEGHAQLEAMTDTELDALLIDHGAAS